MDYKIKDWIENYGNQKRFSELELCDMGWYDWWSRGVSIRTRFTRRCQPLLKRMIHTKLINIDDCYIFFKECMSCAGWKPFWQVKICDSNTDNVIFCITLGEDGRGWSVWDFREGVNYPDKVFKNRALSNVNIRKVYSFFGI